MIVLPAIVATPVFDEEKETTSQDEEEALIVKEESPYVFDAIDPKLIVWLGLASAASSAAATLIIPPVTLFPESELRVEAVLKIACLT